MKFITAVIISPYFIEAEGSLEKCIEKAAKTIVLDAFALEIKELGYDLEDFSKVEHIPKMKNFKQISPPDYEKNKDAVYYMVEYIIQAS